MGLMNRRKTREKSGLDTVLWFTIPSVLEQRFAGVLCAPRPLNMMVGSLWPLLLLFAWMVFPVLAFAAETASVGRGGVDADSAGAMRLLRRWDVGESEVAGGERGRGSYLGER